MRLIVRMESSGLECWTHRRVEALARLARSIRGMSSAYVVQEALRASATHDMPVEARYIQS
jgi:hypothetical protein